MNILKLSTWFLINAIFAALGGLGLIFAPEQFMGPYGIIVTPSVTFLSQLFGAVLLGIAIISWNARGVKDKDGKKALLTGFFVAHVGSAIVGVLAVMSGVVNSMTWVDIAAHAVLAGAFGYYQFVKG